MKLVTAVVKPFKLDEVKTAVQGRRYHRHDRDPSSRVSATRGSHLRSYRGKEYEFDFVDKIRVEIICTDELVDSLIDAIVQAARTDTIGDGVAWVTDIEHVVRIRTNERGPSAL